MKDKTTSDARESQAQNGKSREQISQRLSDPKQRKEKKSYFFCPEVLPRRGRGGSCNKTGERARGKNFLSFGKKFFPAGSHWGSGTMEAARAGEIGLAISPALGAGGAPLPQWPRGLAGAGAEWTR